MEITLEKIELVKDRTGVSYKEAKEALEKTDGDVVNAIILIEDSVDKGSKESDSKVQEIFESIKELIKKGNVSKVVIKRNGEIVLNISVNIGIIGTVVFPWAALASAIAAFGTKCTIEIVKNDGEIIDGSSYDDVAGDRFASIIEQVRKDDNIQAVVLRVNSPGGSVTASEKIKAELDALKEKKPLIASYGCYAASGGYWISNNCDRIFCNPLCITGSIGVFGMVPDLSKLYKDKLHINFMTTSSNAHGDMYSLSRPFDNDEYNYVLRSIEDIYGRFTGMVAEARGLSQERVDEIGQGRVWAGVDALELKLVDDLGGLQDAISYAAAQAGDSELSNWQIKEYPEQLSTVEQIVKSVMDPQQEDFSVLVKKAKECKTAKVQARLPFEMVLQK